MKKILTFLITVFFRHEHAPAINAINKTRSVDVDQVLKEDMVEIKLNICGITQQKNNTVGLSKRDAQKLRESLNNMKEKLEKAATEEEILTVFHNTILVLKQHGLLPKDLSVNQVEQLIMGNYHKYHHIEGVKPKTNKIENYNNYNFLCLIAGEVSGVFFQRIPSFVFEVVGLLLPIVGVLFYILGAVPAMFLDLFNPFWVNSMIGIGGIVPETQERVPARGWIYTYGLLGEKKWEGSVIGGFPLAMVFEFSFLLGVIGFTGIKIRTSDIDLLRNFFIGFALGVNIE